MPKKKDSTAPLRRKRRNRRIKDHGLVERPVLMHPDHAQIIRDYAKSLYEEKGIKF